MGRPLKKDVKGTEVLGTAATTSAGIRVSFYDGSTLQTDGIIIKQRGAGTFQVARVGTPLVRTNCVLVSDTPNAVSEMQIVGYVGGNGAQPTILRRISRRLALDWSGNRYTWYLENDSSNDYIVLTPVTA
jgi:hypothetical protein